MPKRRYRRRTRRRGSGGRTFLALLAMVLFIAAAVLVLGKIQGIGGGRRPMVKYTAEIRQYAAEYELEPAYIAAVIMSESSYRPQAVSSADARGLMQLLPSTAEWIAGKLGEEFSEETLFDPETNIRYGTWYLHFLMERYNGDKRCASAAYHAGQGTVDAWLKNSAYSRDGQTLETIDYPATNTYVNRVLKYYEQYIPVFEEI